ncbi:MAG TPA: hypothetical protein VLV86_02330 [Vicinamibacterales bacterium]|nr:hypothetical protein [Vicinamibacterales bacterium]
MSAISVANNIAARNLTYASVLAQQKMEQLRGLAWGFDNLGLLVTDITTDTAAPIESATGGTGLSPSPAGTLTSNVEGWVDYVDQFGHVLGGGTTPLPQTAYTRRWAVEPLADNPNATIAIHVLVTPRRNRGLADGDGSTVRLPDEARLVTVKTRKAL